jgi:hypothetical protein
MHLYINILRISRTNHFLNQLQYLMTIFACVFHYSNNLINRTGGLHAPKGLVTEKGLAVPTEETARYID